MLVHKCGSGTEEHLPTQHKIMKFADTNILPPQTREHLTTELVKFCALDLRPYSAVSGDGFQSLCETLVSYGARYGKFNVKKALPDHTTTARHVPEIVESTKAAVRQELAQCDYIALTTDGWTDDFRKTSYVTVTAHYFDAELNLQSCILNTGVVDKRKTAEVLGNVVKEVVVDFGFEMNKVTIVKDNASNMIAAFRDHTCRLSCFAHCLNLVVNDMISVIGAARIFCRGGQKSRRRVASAEGARSRRRR